MDILEKLKINNKDVLLEFLILFSRMEYALKRSEFYNKGKESAEADWTRFISSIKNSFNPDKNTTLRQASDYLLKYPAREQIIDNKELDFRKHVTTQEGPDICKIYHCIRITRNNLFHGGKFPEKPEEEISRNRELVNSCIILLKEFVELNQSVEHMFWEVL